MRNGWAMTLCYNIRGIDALLDLTLSLTSLTPTQVFVART